MASSRSNSRLQLGSGPLGALTMGSALAPIVGASVHTDVHKPLSAATIQCAGAR